MRVLECANDGNVPMWTVWWFTTSEWLDASPGKLGGPLTLLVEARARQVERGREAKVSVAVEAVDTKETSTNKRSRRAPNLQRIRRIFPLSVYHCNCNEADVTEGLGKAAVPARKSRTIGVNS